jgi:hypothetical protein
MPLPFPPPNSVDPPAIVQPLQLSATDPVDRIIPGGEWQDDRGKEIQAHGGGVLRVGETFYWFGEDYSPGNLPGHRCVGCYSSTDLMNWTFRGQVVDIAKPTEIRSRGWILERPKVYHNAKTGKFVMWAHVDSGSYRMASVAVFISDTVDGEYKLQRIFRPLGLESRDIGQFVDDDGAAYLIFESRPSGGFFIARLTDDYLNVAEKTCFLKYPLEGGSLAHYQGLYYVVGSYMTGWAPNPDQYATATSLKGPWSPLRDIAPPASKTYGSQSAFLLKIVGSQNTDVIFIGDKWRPDALDDSRYNWMPLDIGDGKLQLPAPRPWAIDVRSGVLSFR